MDNNTEEFEKLKKTLDGRPKIDLNSTLRMIYDLRAEVYDLPCLNSNNSTETSPEDEKQPCILSTQNRKSLFAHQGNIKAFIDKHGKKRVGFLTLTFKDNVQSHCEASRRLNSLITHQIKLRYKSYIGCAERQKHGRIHYHLLVNVGKDIRTGLDFKALKRKDYRSACSALRDEWIFWTGTKTKKGVAEKYRFGRTELLPIRTNSEAASKYLSKYLQKAIETREKRDKGVRLIRCSNDARIYKTRFTFFSPGSTLWRGKVARLADNLTRSIRSVFPDFERITDASGISKQLGPRWAYIWRAHILGLEPFPM
jgi:hypothetical protein